MHWIKLCVASVAVLLLQNVSVEGTLEITQCNDGWMDINEDSTLTVVSCTGYNEMDVVTITLFTNFNSQTAVFTCSSSGGQCGVIGNNIAATVTKFVTSIYGYSETRLEISSNHRALLDRGRIQCFGYNETRQGVYATCNTNVVRPAVISGCNVHLNTWSVAGSCKYDRVYTSNGTLYCTWYQTITTTTVTQNTISGVINPTGQYNANNGKSYLNGTCSLPVHVLQTTEGVYLYRLHFYPGGLSTELAGRVSIKRPGSPVINCSDIVAEGSDVFCTCTANTVTVGSPPPSYFQWEGFLAGPTLTLSNVTRQQDGRVYTCKQFWGPPADYDIRTVNFTLNVAYGPDNVTVTQVYPSPPSSNVVTLQCSAGDVNPSANFTWLGVNCTNVSVNSQGDVSNCSFVTSPGDDRNVTCSASNSMFPDRNGTFTLHIVADPETSMPPESTTSTTSTTTSAEGNPSNSINQNSESSVAAIAGGVAGAGVLLIIVVVVVVVVVKRRKSTRKPDEEATMQANSPPDDDDHDDTEEHINTMYQSSDDVVEPSPLQHQQQSNKPTAVTKPYSSEPQDQNSNFATAAVVNNPTTDENDNKNDGNDDEYGDENNDENNDDDIEEEQLDIGYSSVSFKKASREATANRDSPNGVDSLPSNKGKDVENGNQQSNYSFGIDDYTSAEDSAGYAAVGGSSAGRKSQGLSSATASDVDPYYSTVRNSRAGETATKMGIAPDGNIDRSSSARGSSLYTDVDPYTQVDGDYSAIEDKANRNVSTTSNSTARPVSTEIDAGDYVSIDAAARTSGNTSGPGNKGSAKSAAPSSNGNSVNRGEGQTRPRVSSTGKTDSTGYQSVGEAGNADSQAHVVGPEGDEYAVVNKPTTTAGKTEDISDSTSPQHDHEEHVVGPDGDEYAVVNKPNKPSTTTDGKTETISAPIGLPPQHDNEDYAVVNKLKKPHQDPNTPHQDSTTPNHDSKIPHNDPNNPHHDSIPSEPDSNSSQHGSDNIPTSEAHTSNVYAQVNESSSKGDHQTSVEKSNSTQKETGTGNLSPQTTLEHEGDMSTPQNHKPKPAVKPKPDLKPKPSH